MALSVEQFTQRLIDSTILSPEDVRGLVAALPKERRPQDGEALARELVRQQKLTGFQARQIYNGKAKNLVLGNYVLVDKLGEGGMGVVFKARHRRMDRLVALKILSQDVTESPDVLRRFHREVKAAARLQHPNIVMAYDADDSNGTHFLVMEFVDGIDLGTCVKRNGPVSVEQAVQYILQAACGLGYAHGQGVVHHDIKPANLLLGAQYTIKILDMGLARLDAAVTGQDELTSSGQILGTVDYMSPEQATNTRLADGRADIYSLGMTWWFLLTGRPAFDGSTMVEKLMAHQSRPAPALVAARNDVPAQLEAVYQRMVAKRPEDRFARMAEVITAINATLANKTPAVVAPVSRVDPLANNALSTESDLGAGMTVHPEVADAPTPMASADQNTLADSSPHAETRRQVSSPPPIAARHRPPSLRRPQASPLPPMAARYRPPGPQRPSPHRIHRLPHPLIWVAAGIFAWLLLLAGILVVIRDKSGNDVAREKMPVGGSPTVPAVAKDTGGAAEEPPLPLLRGSGLQQRAAD